MGKKSSTKEEPTPFYDFAGLKSLLRNMGYQVDSAVGYRPIQAKDIGASEIRNNIIMKDDGIFYKDEEGELRKIFMYKRVYRLTEHGKPRFHIRQCSTISDFIRRGVFKAEYRGANVETVTVRDRDNFDQETLVTDLPLCRYCQYMAINEYPHTITSSTFVKKLKEEGELLSEDKDTEINHWGYTKDWATVKSRYLKKQNYTCEACGAKMSNPFDHHYLRVYHKNGKKADNRDANLRCVCPICYFHELNILPSKAESVILTEFGDFILRRYLEERKYTCELCGTRVTNRKDYHLMRVHHKNRNVNDNRMSNLQCVCPHCWYIVKTESFTQQEWNDMRYFIAKYKKELQ